MAYRSKAPPRPSPERCADCGRPCRTAYCDGCAPPMRQEFPFANYPAAQEEVQRIRKKGCRHHIWFEGPA